LVVNASLPDRYMIEQIRQSVRVQKIVPQPCFQNYRKMIENIK
jgi:hypothetical protein